MTRPTTRPAKRPAFESPRELVRPAGNDPDMPRPIAITAGAGLVMLRVIAGMLWLAALAFNWEAIARDVDVALDGVALTNDAKAVGLAVVLSAGGAVTLAEGVLAVLIYRGKNWARVLVMLYTVVSISTTFTTWWVGGRDIRLETTLITLSLDILVLLALSSRPAAAYARRRQRQ